MIKKLQELYINSEQTLIYKPILLRLNNASDKAIFTNLIEEGFVTKVYDEIYSQLQELIKSLNPSCKIKPNEYKSLILKHLDGLNIQDYGVWIYYSWNNCLVHLLDEDEFIEVRTNRNQYKITRVERDVLSKKKIGIIGLSVGQSIAITLAMERGFGELRLADFDMLELSNLNRIRTGVHNLNVPKVVIAAREIAEIDPFLKITCFFSGLTESNIDEFFTQNGRLDLLVDECDSLDMKIISRYKARDLRIPVVMDTSDRGMLDIERFDLEPARPILHGTVEGVDPQNIKGLSNEDKIPILLQMLGVENISLRGKASMIEVEQTINTWPQLASSVTLGGAVGADVCRRILLDHFHESGRYYIDLDDIIADKKIDSLSATAQSNPFSTLTEDEMNIITDDCVIKIDHQDLSLNKDIIIELVKSACAAPSTGNDQPWKWFYKSNILYLYHDEYRSYSFGDFQKIASFITFGAAYENLYIHALSLGIEPYYDFLPHHSKENLVAAIRFKKIEDYSIAGFLKPLDSAIFKRHTNRNIAPRTELSSAVFDELSLFAESIPHVKLRWFTDEDDMKAIGKIIGACDRNRLLNSKGHHDFVYHEMRWTTKDAENTKDGIDIKTLGLSNSELAALKIIKEDGVIRALKDIGGGHALEMLAKKIVDSASALCMITLPKYELRSFFHGGRSMERLWLAATNLNLALHPVISPFYLFPRIVHGNGEGLDEKSIDELMLLRAEFLNITGLEDNLAEVFIAKIAVAEEPTLKSHRLPLEKVLFMK